MDKIDKLNFFYFYEYLLNKIKKWEKEAEKALNKWRLTKQMEDYNYWLKMEKSLSSAWAMLAQVKYNLKKTKVLN